MFYLCSDWSTDGGNSSFVDILDESGNYLYATDYRNVWFNKDYAYKSYKWQINRIKTPVASIGIELDQDEYEVGSNFSGTYSASVSGYDDESVFIQYAMSKDYPGDGDTGWNEIIATGGSMVYHQDAMEKLKEGGIVVYLEISFKNMTRRIRNFKTRGVVLKEGYSLKDMYDERAELYKKYADITIDVNKNSIDDTVNQIIESIKSFN